MDRADRDEALASEADLRHAIERILAPLGRRVDDAEPLVDARLPEGSVCSWQWSRRGFEIVKFLSGVLVRWRARA
jgi:Flp pilus assembly CpaF family ATPase